MAPRGRAAAAKAKDTESQVSAATTNGTATNGNGKKRVASRDPSPEGNETDISSQSQTKKRKGKDENQEPTAPTRLSKRTSTIQSSQQSAANAQVSKASSAKSKPAASAASATTTKTHTEPKPKPAPKPSLNPLVEPASHPRPPRQLFVFGSGDMGQLGLGPDVLGPITRPRLHAWFDSAVGNGTLGGEKAGIERACVGGMHSLVIDEIGRVWSWGINDNAALGRQTTGQTDPATGEPIEAEVFETQPMVVQKLVDDGFRAVSVAAGDSVSIAISDKGEIRAWGSFRSSDGILGFDGKVGSPQHQFVPIALPNLHKEQIVAVACGSDHVLALTTRGYVFTWGDGQQLQLGRKIMERRRKNGLEPERLALRDIVLVGSGNYHSFAVNSHGQVFAWGLNTLGQCGISDEDGGAEEQITSPTIVRALSPETLGGDRRVIAISGGEHHSLFLVSDGSVWGCGRNDNSQLGLAQDHPATIEHQKRKAAAMETDPPGAIEDCIREPVQIFFPPPPNPNDNDPPLHPYAPHAAGEPLLSPIVQISAGTRHNLAVSKQGIVYSWGYGANDQLGMGGADEQPVPARVKSKAIGGWHAEAAYAGGQHCIILATNPPQEETS